MFGSMEPLEGGWSGETFIATLPGSRAVVRIFADPRHAPHAAEIQRSLLRLVRGLVPVPQVLEVRRPDPATGMPALLMTEFVEGVRGDLLLPTLVGDELGEVGVRLGRVAGTLAGMPYAEAGTFTGPDLGVAPYAGGLADFVEAALPGLDWPGTVVDGLREVAAEADERLDAVGRSSLVHADLNPKNVLLDPETHAITAVVDWEFAYAGSPYADLGNLLRFDRRPAYVDGVLSGWLEVRGGDVGGGEAGVALGLARRADLVALVDLATRAGSSPVADRAHDLLRAVAEQRDVHAEPR
jgi:aminoglycoside phosphotransferase (APT) family kinase protein